MTNFEKIKAMTIEEMALFFSVIEDCCDLCALKGTPCHETKCRCRDGIKSKLEAETKECPLY